MTDQRQEDIERLKEASDLLKGMRDFAEQQLPLSDDRAQMMMSFSLARSYLVEFAVHLSRGLNGDDAIAATAKGRLEPTSELDDYRRSLN